MTQVKKPVRSHRDLEAWQHAMDLLDVMYDLADLLPRQETYGLAIQLKRAAVSVASNIAEGHGREHLGDYLRSLSFSMGSVSELDTLVEVCLRRRHITQAHAATALPMIDRQGRILRGLTDALKRRYRAPSTQHPEPSTRLRR